MIKTRILSIALATAINAMSIPAQASDVSAIQGNGSVEEHNRRMVSFKAVNIDLPYEIDLQLDKSEVFSVTTDSNLQEYISTKVQDGVLYIKLKNSVKCITPTVLKVRMKENLLGSVTIHRGVLKVSDRVRISGSPATLTNSCTQ